jgi:hypothetical protein
MKILWVLIAAGFIVSCSSSQRLNDDKNQEHWIQLFNGKNLDGWDVKITGFNLNDNYQNTFAAGNGVMKVQYKGYPEFGNRFGHIFYKEPFSYYKLRVEYRFVGEQAKGGQGWALRNSGVMLHSQSAASMGKDQDFPISLEAQFLGGDGVNERPTLNLCTPGTHVYIADTLTTTHCINSSSRTYHGEQWVSAEFLVLGDSLIQHMIDGKVVMQYSKPVIGGAVVNNFKADVKKDGTPLTQGYIALQSESHPIEFRKVELLNLEGCTDPRALNYKSYYRKPNPSACIY